MPLVPLRTKNNDPATPTFTVIDHGSSMVLTFRPRNKALTILSISMALVIAIWIPSPLLPTAKYDWASAVFMASIVVLGGLFGVFLVTLFVFAVAGRLSEQTVTVTPAAIVIAPDASPKGPRPKEYAAQRIRNLRVSAGFRGSLVFDYGKATIRFAPGLNEEEARQILDKIRQGYLAHEQK